MDRKIECPICFEYFYEPKVLPCGHTFCHKCLFLIKQNSKITCPECNRVYQNISLNSLPRNYVLEKVIDSHKESDKKQAIELHNLPKPQEKKIIHQKEIKRVQSKPNQNKKNLQIEERLLDPIEDHQLYPYINYNSRLLMKFCKFNTFIILFLLGLNTLLVTHNQVILGICYRVLLFIFSVFSSYKIPSCTQNLLDWQLTWYISNLFMSAFSYYRIKLFVSKLFRVLVSLLFYISGLVLCYSLYIGYNESYFEKCGGNINLLTMSEKAIFFSDLGLNVLFCCPYLVALVIGYKLKTEDN